MKRQKTKFDLIENAKDSLAHAVEHLTRPEGPTVGDLKRVILDVAHVVELILKERICRIHPAFIWESVDKYPSPVAQTIGTDKAVSRLLNLAGITLPVGAKKTLLACRKIRNSIEHREFEMEPKEARAIVGRMLSFIFNFAKRYLKLDLETDFKQDDRWSALIDIYEFWEAHSVALGKQLSEERKPVWDCPSCGAGTFDPSLMKCALCGHTEELVECDVCHEMVRESDTETIEGMNGNEESGVDYFSATICRTCLDKEEAVEAAADALRDEWKDR